MQADETDSPEYDGPSRSQLRREALDVLALAKALVELTDARLDRVPLSEDLHELVIESRRITANIARKRQMQFLAKHLRRAEDELPAIRAAIEQDLGERRSAAAGMHRAEAWRDRLVAEGDEALNTLLESHPDADRQRLRQLARRAQDERDANKPPAAARELFRALRMLFGA
ncbi:MAG TPA: ribosome biogenesis factor YjgA [Candidatus Saccharimonadia bacterium]|nr:ribosome biogenesis factor YjgA [Candidatus Saccharimonadia bacterium]